MIGDDTVMMKTGKNMPDITVVYKSSEGYFGLGYALPSTHYADGDKDYPLFAQVHYRTPEQKQEAEDKRLQRRKKLDVRRPEDVKKWLTELIDQGRPPEVVVLRGPLLSLKMVGYCEELNLKWVGISASNRKYRLGQKKEETTRSLLKRTPKTWQVLDDEGFRMVCLGPAQSGTMGTVNLLMVEQMEDGSRMLCITSTGNDEDKGLELVRTMISIERSAPGNSKLRDMLRLLKKSSGFILAETAVFDRWFYVPWFIRSVLVEIGFKRVIVKCKSDRPYSVNGHAKTWKEWESEVRKYDRYTVRGRPVNLARLKVTDPDLGTVQLVFVQEINTRLRKGESVEEIGPCYALMCTDPRWKPDKVFRAHKLRWKIEEFYREARQNHGFDKFHGRDKEAIHGHIVFALMSYICVSLCRLWNPLLKDKTLGEIKRRLFRGVVKLKHQNGNIIVCFDPGWVDTYGLPDFCHAPIIERRQGIAGGEN